MLVSFPIAGESNWREELERGSAHLRSQFQGTAGDTMATRAAGSWSHCIHRQEAEGHECPCLAGGFVSSALVPWSVMSDSGVVIQRKLT